MTLGHQQHWVETQYDAGYRDFENLTLNVEPAERVGAPLPNRYKRRLRRMLAGIILVAGAWAVVANQGLPSLVASARSFFDVIVSNAQEIASRANREGQPGPAVSTTTGLTSPNAPAPQMEQSSAAELVPELTPTQDEKTAPAAAGEVPSTETMGTAYAEKAEPVEEAQDKSPKRKHAIAAGLSPDLPNVLLTRLSKADLQNAAYAIKTALAKTSDDSKFTWPASPSRHQALFEVHFVPGASQGCRRYIVTVMKDRWSSTSAALEKCGDTQPHAASVSKF